MHKNAMKKAMIITSICTVVITLLLTWCVTIISDTVNSSKDWKSREALGKNAPYNGKIVHIADFEDGFILYVDTFGVTSANKELFEVWVYEDTVLLGEIEGVSLQNMVENGVSGAYVTMECFEGTEIIQEGHLLHPAMIISIVDK